MCIDLKIPVMEGDIAVVMPDPVVVQQHVVDANADQTGQAIRQRLIQRFAAMWLIHSCTYCYTQMYIYICKLILANF